MKFAKAAVNRALSKRGYRVVRVASEARPADSMLAPSPSEHEKTAEEQAASSLAREQKVFQTKFNRYLKSHNVVKLHFGCGPRILKDWVNIDLAFEPFEQYLKYYTDKHYPPVIRGTETDFYALDTTRGPLPIPDNTADVIFHEDFMEHISQRDQVAFLSETLRVLKKGGIHRVNTPNLAKSMRDHSSFSKGFKGVYFNEWDKHQHISVLTDAMLEEMALMVGYSKVLFNKKNGSTSTLIPLEYRPDPKDRPVDGNVFADLIK